MNLRKDHYRERQGGGPQGPSSPRPTRDPRAAGAAWEREAPGRVAPGARSPATSPAGPQRNAPAGGGGAGVAARGATPPRARHPRALPAGRPSRVPLGPASAPTRGGGRGPEGLEASRREPLRGGLPAERPDAHGRRGRAARFRPRRPALGAGRETTTSPLSTLPKRETKKRARLLAVDHSARASMKNAASCEN